MATPTQFTQPQAQEYGGGESIVHILATYANYNAQKHCALGLFVDTA